MGTAIVATAQVNDISALINQLNNLQFGESSYYLLQSANKITDWEKGTPDEAEIKAYTRGRLFDKNREIRWQKTADGYSLLWLSEGDTPEGFESFGEWGISESHDIFLLGGGETEPWRDTRIPRDLDYPIDWCKYPCVKVIQYKESNSQTIRFTRYTEFIGKKGA